MAKKNMISFDEFVAICGLKKSTIQRRYKMIPGIEKVNGEYRVLSGTRYPFNMRRYKIQDARDRRYVLLRAISEYKYISHLELKIENKQFEEILKEFLSAKLIKENGLSNHYGANAYDITSKGLDILGKEKAKEELSLIIARCSGIFVGTVLSIAFK